MELFEFDQFSTLFPTSPTISIHYRQHRRSFFGAVVHNAEKLELFWVNAEKHTNELKLEQFSALLPTTRKNDRRCRHQCGVFFCDVGNSAEKCSALWATTWNNCHNAEQYNSLWASLYSERGSLPQLKTHFTPIPSALKKMCWKPLYLQIFFKFWVALRILINFRTSMQPVRIELIKAKKLIKNLVRLSL